MQNFKFKLLWIIVLVLFALQIYAFISIFEIKQIKNNSIPRMERLEIRYNALKDSTIKYHMLVSDMLLMRIIATNGEYRHAKAKYDFFSYELERIANRYNENTADYTVEQLDFAGLPARLRPEI